MCFDCLAPILLGEKCSQIKIYLNISYLVQALNCYLKLLEKKAIIN